MSASTWWFSRSSIGRHVTGISPRSIRAQTRSVASTSRTGRRPMPGNGFMLLRADSDIATDYVVVAE